MARQICGPATPILSFGMDRLEFKISGEDERLLALLKKLAIEVR